MAHSQLNLVEGPQVMRNQCYPLLKLKHIPQNNSLPLQLNALTLSVFLCYSVKADITGQLKIDLLNIIKTNQSLDGIYKWVLLMSGVDLLPFFLAFFYVSQ